MKTKALFLLLCGLLSWLPANGEKAEKPKLLEITIDKLNIEADTSTLKEIANPQAFFYNTTLEEFLSKFEKKGAKVEKLFSFSFQLKEGCSVEITFKPEGREVDIKLSALWNERTIFPLVSGEEKELPAILCSLDYKEYTEEMKLLAREHNLPIVPLTKIETGGYPGICVPAGGMTLIHKRVENVKEETGKERTFASLLFVRGKRTQ